MHQNRCDFFIYNKKRSLTMKVKLLKFISLQLLWVGGADNFLDQKEQGEEKHGIYGTRKRTSSRPI